MHLRIRADIFNAAIHFAATTGDRSLTYHKVFPTSDNDFLTYEMLIKEVPAIQDAYMYFVSQWDGDRHPVATFFSIDPPGTWMSLRKLIGPEAMDPWDLHEQLDSEEALGVVLQHFLPALEKQLDEWNRLTYTH